jgi:DNA-binding SARP family transcriptional activator
VTFGVLGPLQVHADGVDLPVGGPKPRLVLAMLLLNAGRVVSAERLIDGLWAEEPPAGASNTLQAHVSHVRRALEGTDAVLLTRPPGYLLQIAPGALDLHRFDAMTQQGRESLAHGDCAAAAEWLREALALWRGPALEDLVAGPFTDSARAFLDERRLGVVDDRLELLLRLRQDHQVIEVCEAVLADDPLRESVWQHLILALYRSGRQAEALAKYRQCRDVLLEELGVEPMPRLRRLEQQILNHDRHLDPGPRTTGAYVVATTAHTRPTGAATMVRSARLAAELVVDDGTVVELTDRVTLGRHPGCEVVLDDPSVSRRHAEIRLANGRHVLLDLSSSNGTWVAGQPVLQHVLADGDEFQVGDKSLRYRTSVPRG